MNSFQRPSPNTSFRHSARMPAASGSPARHGGAVIIVVISLLTTLLFLGLFFFNWTSQERATADVFGSVDTLELDRDAIFDAALEQVLVGTRSQYNQSVLAGSDFSMLAGILGRPAETGNGLEFDAFPRNGRGISIIVNDTDNDLKPDNTNFGVDYDGDGSADATQTNFVLNMSPAANGGTASSYRTQFAPDAGYTYPDQNSMFLAFDGYVPQPSNPTNEYRVVIPSFFRPQLLSVRRTQTPPPTGRFNDLYTASGASGTQAKVFRPHQSHVDVYNNSYSRYVTASSGATASSGDTSRIIPQMPFTNDVNGDGRVNDAGIFTASDLTVPFTYEYDGDVDRDGVRDSILMDLGYPLIDLPGGRQVVPLFMMKWIDADGLLNVNVHGNIANFELLQQKMVVENGGTPPTWKPTVMAGKSNLGISASEVNLSRALFADPSDGNYITQSVDMLNWALNQHRGMFGLNLFPNVNNISRTVMANMETIMLLCGRRQFAYDGSSIANSNDLPGRRGLDANASIADMVSYGTKNLTSSNSSYTPNFSANASSVGAPKPGLQDLAATPAYDEGNDDANDLNQEKLNANFGMPIDYLGIGASTQTKTGVQGKVQALSDGSAVFSSTWSVANLGPGIVKYPQYNKFWGASRYSSNNAYATNLQGNAITVSSNEEDEMFIEPGLRMTSRDRVFETAEMFALLASDGDRTAAGTSSRLLDLASFNFRDNRYAYRIRPQFTTDSWDRLEFSYSPLASRAWEFNNWNKNTTDFGLLTSYAITSAFPPKFLNAAVNSTIDPFRPEVRRALASISGATGTVGRWDFQSQGFRSLRLNLNRLLSAYNADGTPKFTEFTKHQTAAVHGGDGTTLPNTLVTTGSNEWKARHERQRMARDIYVLLYTLGGGNDNVDYSQTPNTDTGMGIRALYNNDELKEMAQFAVNVVDELDPDNVITVFEYDRDLSDGWNLDDNAFDDTADSSAPYNIPSGDRGVVYGVEAQTLSLSEVLLVRAQDDSSDNPSTSWNDTAPTAFGYIELQSVLPRSVNFSQEKWRVRIEVDGAIAKSLILKTGTVAAGAQFSIGTVSDNTQPNSNFRVDPAGGSSVVTIIPANDTTNPLDFDLITKNMGATAGTDYYVIDDNGPSVQGTPGNFFPAASATTALTAPKTTVSLWRKVTLDRDLNTDPTATVYEDEEDDNPWVRVDFVEITGAADTNGGVQNFNPGGTLATELQNLRSRERPQPFDRRGERKHTNASNSNNTVGDFNEASQPTASNGVLDNGFTLWQPHFDRDFTSKYALLSVPLYGPDQTTNQLAYDSGTNARMHWDTAEPTWGNIAARKFCLPQDPSNKGSSTPDHKLDNRWYRILEFFEVDNRELQRLQNLVTSFRRTPGQINLNTLRHEPVLAALIDDDQINNIQVNTAPTPDNWNNAMEGAATDDIYTSGRNWFRALQQARDGYDPALASSLQLTASGAINLPIPGSPGSHPYRSGTYISEGNPSVDWNIQTQMIRNHIALYAAPYFGLFEARDSSETQVDYHTRNRLLQKIANHATNRSHVFAGWIEIELHEAHYPDQTNFPNTVQVGGKADDLPTYRMFCVVDMSRLEEAYDARNNTYDFRKFIIHRQLLP